MLWERCYYSHLKVFGCKGFAHVLKEQIQKLDNKAVSCIFLGYRDAELGYKLWDPVKKKVFRSRDVIFQEYKTLLDFETTEKSTSSNNDISFSVPIAPPTKNVTNDNELHEEHGSNGILE